MQFKVSVSASETTVKGSSVFVEVSLRCQKKSYDDEPRAVFVELNDKLPTNSATVDFSR